MSGMFIEYLGTVAEPKLVYVMPKYIPVDPEFAETMRKVAKELIGIVR